MNVEKHGYIIKLTDEQLETAEVFPVTFHQAETWEDREHRMQLGQIARLREVVALIRKAPEALRPIIKLHVPNEYQECMGCDAGAYAESGADWPCRTIELIQEGL